MAEMFFFAILTLVVLGSGAWLLFDFGELWRDRAPAWPQRFARAERVPAWLRKTAGACAPNDLPPTLGPARLPSFAWHAAPDVDAKHGSPRRGHRPRRSRTSTLRPAV